MKTKREQLSEIARTLWHLDLTHEAEGRALDQIEALYAPEMERLANAVEYVKNRWITLATLTKAPDDEINFGEYIQGLQKILCPEPEKSNAEMAFEETFKDSLFFGNINDKRAEFKANLERIEREGK